MLAPIALIGGFLSAAALQPAGYSSVRDTISALAERGAPHRWVMSLALVLLGICHLTTATGIRPARLSGRLMLALGGVFTVLVAVFPLPAEGSSSAHVTVAGIAFAALAIWPALASGGRRGLLSRRTGLVWSGLLLVLVFVFLAAPDSSSGLWERIAAGAEALCPLALIGARRRL